MTPVNNPNSYMWIALGMVACFGLTAAGQQPLPTPPDADEIPPEHSVIFNSEEDTSSGSGTRESGELINAPVAEAYGDRVIQGPAMPGLDPGCVDCQNPGYDLWDGYPALMESSGTWLRRGFWYSEVDAVMLNRISKRSRVLLASEGGVPLVDLAPGNRALFFRHANPGYDAGVRFTLGHFLYRDDNNRDHTAEFTAFAGGDWTHDCGITSLAGNNLLVPDLDNNNQGPFDTADSMHAVYTSRINSFEANYRHRWRMRKDQMVLRPNGDWVRRASPTYTRHYLAGIRFVDLTERLNWTANDIALQNGNDGSYFIRTDNNMIGVQLGGGHSYETGQWSLGIEAKSGIFLNDAKGRQRLIMENNDALSFNTRMAEEQLSFVGEARMLGRVHIRPNFSFRAGYEILYLTSVAMAVNQLHFVPVFSKLGTTGDPFYHGMTLGFEGYW